MYKQVIEKTLAFVSREWKTQEGAFYAALDADSLDANGHLEEGAFYVWKKTDLHQILKDDFELIQQYALSEKSNREVERWFKNALGEVFVKIDPEYESCKILAQ